MSDKKKIRNRIFRVCAVGMLASFLIMLLPDFSARSGSRKPSPCSSSV